MPARDIYHDQVRNALIKDGWTITDDPLPLIIEGDKTYVDLGAERLLAAERRNEKIAVEIKSFLGPSKIRDLETAIGQYILYHAALQQLQPERVLYLAVSQEAFIRVFERSAFGVLFLKTERMQLIVFDSKKEIILKWLT